MSETLTLLSPNVRGLTNFKKRRTVFTWCHKKNADIDFFLQETHSKRDTEVQWGNEWGTNVVLAHGNSNSRGVAILMKKGIDCTIHSKIIDPQGCYIILKAAIADQKYTLINIYAPNKDNDIVDFFEKIRKTLQEEYVDADEKVIVGGDFNCPMNPLLDKKGGSSVPRKIAIASIEYFQFGGHLAR